MDHQRPNRKASEALNAPFNPKPGAQEEGSLDKGAEFPPRNNPADRDLCEIGRGDGVI
jgi:hypothetical protein